jgi:hypothetical protein
MIRIPRPHPRIPFLRIVGGACFAVLVASGNALAAETVPTDVQMPGTQPEDGVNVESVSKCDNCHGNFANPADPREEPWFKSVGSSRPLFRVRELRVMTNPRGISG